MGRRTDNTVSLMVSLARVYAFVKNECVSEKVGQAPLRCWLRRASRLALRRTLDPTHCRLRFVPGFVDPTEFSTRRFSLTEARRTQRKKWNYERRERNERGAVGSEL